MASRRSIIAANKALAMSGNGSQGAPQSSGGWGTNAAAMANSGTYSTGWAAAYGQPSPGLPRPPGIFTDGAFGPLSPILPVPVNNPPEGSSFVEPRLFENEVGWNLPVGQPGSEGIKLADFGTLKTLADLYSVARACIQLRKNEIRGIEWDILPTRDASKAMRGSPGLAKSFGARRSEAVKFFKRPDPDFFNWASFLDALCEEVFVYDALSILIRPKWSRGRGAGLLGSDLDSLSLLSGPTIRPLLGLHAERPRPPAPAYQQYLYGVPRVDLMSLVTERDLEDGMLSGSEMGQFRADQLLYLPMTPRRWTPYGFPPIERALIPVMAGLQKQGFQLDYYREGSVPAVYVSPGGANANMTPNQIRELQDALNAIAGDPAWKHKIIVLPADSKVMPQKQAQLADQFDEIVMNQVCMAFDVQPMELGIMPKVSTSVSPGAANQMSKASQNIHERKATKPFLSFVADIMNVILQEVCGQTDMRFMFEGLEEGEDEQVKTEILISQVGAALRSIDEAREELDLQPWGLPETSDPGWATSTGWTPLTEAIAAQRTDSMEGSVFGQGPVDPSAGGPQADGASADPGAGPEPGSPAAPGSMEDASPAAGVEVPDGTPGHAAAQASADIPTAEVPLPTAKTVEPEVIKGTPFQELRDKRVEKVMDKVSDQLKQVIEAVRDNKIDRNKAVALSTAFLTSGYKDVISKSIDDAQGDLDLDYTGRESVDNLAWNYGEGQRQWLDGLIQKALDDPDKKLNGRIGIYAQTLEAVYNKSYAQAARSSGKEWVITWNLGPGENCDVCKSRDGSQFTFDTLPGIPGEGAFGGDLCEGGPNCHCSLDFEEKSAHSDTSNKPFDSAGKTRAVLSELEAMVRHARKGRNVAHWDPRHLSPEVMTDIIVRVAKGETVDAVVDDIRQRRTVSSDGQIVWVDFIGEPGQMMDGRSGSYVKRPHDINDIPFTPKGAKDLDDPNPVDSEHIYNMLLSDFDPKGLKWVKAMNWVGPIEVPLDRIDFDDSENWSAAHDTDKVDKFVKMLKKGKKIKPGISVRQMDGDSRVKVVDGHHRALASQIAEVPFVTYVAYVPENDDRWELTHSFQYEKKDGLTGSARVKRPAEKMDGKVSKASVNYRHSDDPNKRCGNCSMFIPSGACTLVEGLIKSEDLCDEWAPTTADKAIHPAAVGDSVGEGASFAEAANQTPTEAPANPQALQTEEEMMNNPELVQFFETGAGAAQIKWGTTGDISRCVTLATQILGLDNAQTFCQIRYSNMTGQQASGLIHAAPSPGGN